MGILNVTPDSFSDGGRYLDEAAAIARGMEMVAEGADVIDVGGESTRPGAASVSDDEQRRRIIGVIEHLAQHTTVSVDTQSPGVATAAVSAGASMINDVSGSLAPVAAETGAAWIVMHMQGDPRSMQVEPRYDDVVAEVLAYLVERAEAADRLGVTETWIDPGWGFGKTHAHNLSLLAEIDRFVATGWPVLLGTSRKSTLGAILGRSDGLDHPTPPDDRLEGSLATATWAAAAGVRMLRVHDVRATVQATKIIHAGS